MLTKQPQCGILYIDDEEKALKYFKMAFSEKFPIFTAESGKAGLELLRREARNIGIVVSDQRMPEMLGAEVLGTVRNEFPHIVRILTTAYSDLDSAIQAVNKGHIYQYVVKPWEIPELEMLLQRAADYYSVLMERNELLALKMTALQRIICGDRLKWLMLAGRSLHEAERGYFHQALGAMIHAMPDAINPTAAASSAYTARDFEITGLLRQEFRNAAQSLGKIDAALQSSLAPADAAMEFSAALAKRIGEGPETAGIQEAAGGRITVSLQTSKPFRQDDVAKGIFGLLAEKETPDLSLHLLKTLVAVARNKGLLIVEITPEGGASKGLRLSFDLTKSQTNTPEDAIECLYEKFSSWDISKL